MQKNKAISRVRKTIFQIDDIQFRSILNLIDHDLPNVKKKRRLAGKITDLGNLVFGSMVITQVLDKDPDRMVLFFGFSVTLIIYLSSYFMVD